MNPKYQAWILESIWSVDTGAVPPDTYSQTHFLVGSLVMKSIPELFPIIKQQDKSTDVKK